VTVRDIPVNTLAGRPSSLAELDGKTLLVVNVASKCGLTPQYTALEALHRRYAPKGFSVLGFPSNDFAGQEPGTEAEIQTFCSTKYDVTFPLFAKVRVLGADKAKVYDYLTHVDAKPKGAGDVTWNFEKFLVDKVGNVVARFNPQAAPDDPEITKAIEAALG
jgi:glutathione peroxidase